MVHVDDERRSSCLHRCHGRKGYESSYGSYSYLYGADSYSQGWVDGDSMYYLYSSYSCEDGSKYLEEPKEEHYLTTKVSESKDSMSEYHNTTKTIQSQLDLVLEVFWCCIREIVLIDECVKPDTFEVEEEAPYMVVELHNLKANCQQEIEVRKLNKVLGVIEEISDPSE